MIAPPVRILFNEAKTDMEFQTELRLAGEKKYSPGIFWDDTDKALFATVYLGWLIGKKIYDPSKYGWSE